MEDRNRTQEKRSSSRESSTSPDYILVAVLQAAALAGGNLQPGGISFCNPNGDGSLFTAPPHNPRTPSGETLA